MEKQQLDARGRPRAPYQTVNDGPQLTVQSDADKADIQKILRRYQDVGIVDHLEITAASFKDVTSFNDFADVIRTAHAAETEFMELPSKVREIFDHDVATWLDTAHDPEKLAALIEAGKIPPLEPPGSNDPPNDDQGAGDSGDTPPGSSEPTE